MAQDSDIVIGLYCEAPDGQIARTFGWGGASGMISYYFDDDRGGRTVHVDEFRASWRMRPDLADFPEARDPILPYTFDLFWDAKRRSDLVTLLADGTEEDEVRKAMEDHGIVLTETETDRIEELRNGGPAPGL